MIRMYGIIRAMIFWHHFGNLVPLPRMKRPYY